MTSTTLKTATTASGRPSDAMDPPSRVLQTLPSAVAPTAGASAPQVAKTFASLGVQPFLVKALEAMAIRLPTEVQAMCIPPILSGRDCIGSAHTGSGKTVAFAIPILQALSFDPSGPFALILTPTRELAFQIASQFRVLGAGLNLSSSVVVGGMDMTAQALELGRRPHVIVATPGRLVDHLMSNEGESGAWGLKRCRYLVLDEADRLLTPTFAEPLAYLINEHLPPPAQRQTLLFTATVTDAVMALEKKAPPAGRAKPFVHVCADRITIPAQLRQFYAFVPSQVKETYLYYLLLNICDLTGAVPSSLRRRPALNGTASKKPSRNGKKRRRDDHDEEPDEDNPVANLPQTIIFVARPYTAHLLHTLLSLPSLPHPIPSAPLHSSLSQTARLASLNLFRSSKVPLLIATDVASRGLDIPEVEVVINWEVPREGDEYVHRVGRTARAGRGGVSVSFVGEGDVECVLGVEERVGKKMEEVKMEEDKVLEYFNVVSGAKREAQLKLQEDKFGEKQKVNKLKNQLKQQALDKADRKAAKRAKNAASTSA